MLIWQIIFTIAKTYEDFIYSIIIEFESWKDEVEERHHCSFVRNKGSVKNSNCETVTMFQCNRSGIFKSKRTGKRRSKSSGMFCLWILEYITFSIKFILV